jgi:hypothetical protein
MAMVVMFMVVMFMVVMFMVVMFMVVMVNMFVDMLMSAFLFGLMGCSGVDVEFYAGNSSATLAFEMEVTISQVQF